MCNTFISLTYILKVKSDGYNQVFSSRNYTRGITVIAYILNHRKTPNIIVTIIDTFSVGNSCMPIIGNLCYYGMLMANQQFPW